MPRTAIGKIRWAELIQAGCPYIKTSIADRFAGSAKLAAVVPAEFLQPDI